MTTEKYVNNNRTIVLIDIMGFKDMVARNKHEVILAKYSEVIRKYEKFSDSMMRNGIGKKPDLVTFSDSLILFSKDDTFPSFVSMSYATSMLMNALFFHGLPFRGAMAYGPMTVDFQKGIYFGQSLIDAYELHNELNFYGVVLHHTAETEIIRNANQTIPLIIEGQCHFKSGMINHKSIRPALPELKRNIAIPKGSRAIEIEDHIRKLATMSSGIHRKYIDNTLDYVARFKNELPLGSEI